MRHTATASSAGCATSRFPALQPKKYLFEGHKLKQGIDIRFIQELLGHNNIKTTLIYTDVTNNSIRNITSPLDKL